MSRIVKVEVGRFDYSVVGEFKFLKPGADGVVRRPSVLVRLTDEDGSQGWGQAVPVPSWSYETPETVEVTLRHYLAEALLGLDVENVSAVHTRMNSVIRPAFSTGQPFCKAAVDLACYDLLAKKAGRRVVDVLGGPQVSSLQLSWTVASAKLGEIEQQLEEGHARGYRNFNIKVGAPQTPAYDLELAKTVQAFAPDSFLWADANTGYTLDAALAIAPQFAEIGVKVLESPLPPNELQGYQALKAQGALPILMDEGIIAPRETAEFIALKMMDGVAMKPARSAGLWASIQIITLLREHNLMVLGSGLTEGDFALCAAAHLYSWAGIDTPCALNGPQFLASSLALQAIRVENDQLHLPPGAGLGIKVKEEIEACMSIAAKS